MTAMARRAFLLAAASSGAALVAGCGGRQSSDVETPPPPFAAKASGPLLRNAVIARALTTFGEGRSGGLGAMSNEPATLGIAVAAPHTQSLADALTDARDRLIDRVRPRDYDQVLRAGALPLGYALHRTADAVIAEGYAAAAVPQTLWADAMALQDAEAAVAALGARPRTTAEALRALEAADLRLRVGLHTFEPYEDPADWAARLAQWAEEQRAWREGLAALMANPPADLYRRVVTGANLPALEIDAARACEAVIAATDAYLARRAGLDATLSQVSRGFSAS